MDLSADTALVLAPLAPFLAAVLAPVVQRFAGHFSGWVLALVPALVFVLLWRYVVPVAGGESIRVALPWGADHGLALSLLVDGLSLTFALTISGVGALILVYSGSYLRGHPHQGRFLSFLLMFMGAMLGLVLADNIVALYTFWELTSVTSFLLIGFDHSRQVARRAAIQALVVTAVGGLALLAAAVLMQRLSGSWELSALGDLRAHSAYPVVLALVLLAAFTKSAQVPFHFWLPNAMEAPTPVSAFLHSATMVQAGVYLLARLNPTLGGTPAWSTLLIVFGAATLLWGGLAALRQTDLKQMLAQTTIASLGLLVLLIGIGGETAALAMLLYFVAHALYKAALFLVAGIIDHETGTRDITVLSGLRDPLAITFIATILAAVSMIGLPPFVGYLAKEEMYAALLGEGWQALLVMAVLIVGNGLLAAVALAVMIKPFMGQTVPLPKDPHEAPFAMLVGPGTFAILGVVAGFLTEWVGERFIAPGASAVYGQHIESHLQLRIDPLSILFWLSLATWLVGGLVYWRLDSIRTLLRRGQLAVGWTFDRGFDSAMFGLVRLSGSLTRLWHHGQLELYLLVVFLSLAVLVIGPLWGLGGLPDLPPVPELTFYEWGVILIAVIGIATVVAAQTRLFAILALGVQGIAVALLFLLFGAPDLSFTQVMVEILSVVILALVMTRLRLDQKDPRQFEDALRDGSLALICGAGITALLFAVLGGTFDPRLSTFFDANSYSAAHGRNVVNVILVDFRGLDTLGEISVVMTAGIAILALVRSARRAPPVAAAPTRRRGRSAPAEAAAS